MYQSWWNEAGGCDELVLDADWLHCPHGSGLEQTSVATPQPLLSLPFRPGGSLDPLIFDHLRPGTNLHFLFCILSGGGKGRDSTCWSPSLPENSSSTSRGKNQKGCSSYCDLLVQVRQSALMESASDPSERAVQANSLLQSQSSNASILFLYLPAPPNLIHPQYLKSLDILTKGLPPTLLVHAVRSVVTTNL